MGLARKVDMAVPYASMVVRSVGLRPVPYVAITACTIAKQVENVVHVVDSVIGKTLSIHSTADKVSKR